MIKFVNEDDMPEEEVNALKFFSQSISDYSKTEEAAELRSRSPEIIKNTFEALIKEKDFRLRTAVCSVSKSCVLNLFGFLLSENNEEISVASLAYASLVIAELMGFYFYEAGKRLDTERGEHHATVH